MDDKDWMNGMSEAEGMKMMEGKFKAFKRQLQNIHAEGLIDRDIDMATSEASMMFMNELVAIYMLIRSISGMVGTDHDKGCMVLAHTPGVRLDRITKGLELAITMTYKHAVDKGRHNTILDALTAVDFEEKVVPRAVKAMEQMKSDTPTSVDELIDSIKIVDAKSDDS